MSAACRVVEVLSDVFVPVQALHRHTAVPSVTATLFISRTALILVQVSEVLDLHHIATTSALSLW